jgi:hypothetical protein
MFCPRPITVEYTVINYITGKSMTPSWGWRVLGNTQYSTYTSPLRLNLAWPKMIGKDANWKMMH